jgi:tyrosine-protein kinase Etk/Wzc
MQENIPTSSQAVDEEEIDFLKYIEIILKCKKMILKVTITAFALSIIIAFLWPKTYESTARILPPQQDKGLMGLMMGQMAGGNGSLASLAGGALGMVTPADQYASILQSERIKDSIIDRFKLMEEYGKEYRADMYVKIDKIVEVKAGRKDGIISISVEDEDPKKAAAIANAYIDELSKLDAEMDMSSAGQNRSFLEGRLAKAKADLIRSEDALKVFQTRNMAVNVTDQAKASIEGVALLKAQLAVQEAQRSALLSQFTDSTQEVQNSKATVINLKNQIAKLEGNGTGSIPSVGSVPGLAQEQIRLLREFKTQEMLVDLLTKQNELAKLAETKNSNTIQVIQKATVPDKKIKPKRTLIVLGITFISFCSSVLWVLLKDFRENLSDEDSTKIKRVKAAFAWEQSPD